MKIGLISRMFARKSSAAFTLVEPVIGMAILLVLIVAFYSGIAQGIFSMRMARENQRATQILLQKTETIRLCKWAQLTNGFIPTTFSTTYIPSGSSQGIRYDGDIRIANAPVDAPYTNDLKMVTIRLSWKTGGVQRNREMATLISRWGLNNYVD